MIAIELRGRMGNQMFRYAFARALYEARGRHDNLLLGCGNYTNLDVSKSYCCNKGTCQTTCIFFFSDDINWVKNNIICNDECYFEDNCNPIWECLRLMYSCKHFIISNSTFSWWGQYLSRNENKLVVAPSIWYNIENETAHLLEDNWIKIDI